MDNLTTPDGTIIWHDKTCTVTVRRDTVSGRDLRLVWEFHSDEAQGTLTFEEGGYGVYVTCPQVEETEPTLLLDLFYQSRSRPADLGEGGPPLQVVLYDPQAPGGDPWGLVQYTPDTVTVRRGA